MKIEDVVLLVLIVAIVGIALWLLSGSPPDSDALITLALFVAASELLIWRNMFSMDKKTTVGFIKVKHDLDKFEKDVNNRFDGVDNKLVEILGKIK
ncbi:hypothetical protein CMI38_01695 [Candidatus Pacearchaeota archaeon]|nr:hypothetical protein [Candidatus Pacearchaeota archaeon]